MNQHPDFEELGRKVQCAQQELEKVRGTGTVDGIRVTVDAENRLLSVTLPEEDAIVAAYNAAVADKQPQVDRAVSELRTDPRFEAVSLFAEANSARLAADESSQSPNFEQDDDYYAERGRHGWLER